MTQFIFIQKNNQRKNESFVCEIKMIYMKYESRINKPVNFMFIDLQFW